MILLRSASAADAATFESFDLGDTSAAHLTEVVEIVSELWPSVQDPTAVQHDRQVHIAVEDHDIVGVVALVDEAGSAIAGHSPVDHLSRQCPVGRSPHR